MTTFAWKHHDSFEAQADGETYYVNWEGDGYAILLKFFHRGRNRWMPYGRRDTIEEAKEFWEKAHADHLENAAA